MKTLKLFTYILLSVFFSCKTTSETRTTKIDDADFKADEGIIYALPKTNLRFKVEAVRTDVFPGPYYEYAEKYMGIENVPREEKSVWQITNINIESYNDIDPEQYYIIEPSGKMNVDLMALVENGTIFPVNQNNNEIFLNQFYGKNNLGNDIVFKDLSVTKYVGEEKVTYYKRVQRDSLFAKVPVVKTQSVYKSFEDKAEEAANFIFMIREKRFELLTGMADFYPEGKSLEVAIAELNRLENEYLDLFIGKRYTSTYTAGFEFTPTGTGLDQPHILFRFSEEKGILTSNDLTGRPIIVELGKMNQTNNLSHLMSDQVNREGVVYKNKLYYRIPDLAQIKVSDGKSLLATRKIKIHQFGEVIPFPTMFLMDEEKFIEFYRDEDEE